MENFTKPFILNSIYISSSIKNGTINFYPFFYIENVSMCILKRDFRKINVFFFPFYKFFLIFHSSFFFVIKISINFKCLINT
jgi:hypothetical protein